MSPSEPHGLIESPTARSHPLSTANHSAFSSRAARLFLRNFAIGEVLALLVSLTGVWTTYLVNRSSSYPLLQSATSYLFISLVYLPLFLYLYRTHRHETWSNFTFLQHPWRYAILALADLEANFLVVKAYEYTTITSVQLFSCLTTPCVLFLSVVILRTSFGLTHVFGTLLALAGLAFLIVMDAQESTPSGKGSQVIGDVLCVGSSFLYALSNVLTEWFIKPKVAREAEPEGGAQERGEGGLHHPATPHRETEGELDVRSSEMDSNSWTRAGMKTLGTDDVEGEPVDVILEDDGRIEAMPSDRGSSGSSTAAARLVPPYIPIVENVAMMATIALVFAVIQFFAIEYRNFDGSSWGRMESAYQIFFGLTMLGVYTLLPITFYLCSACFANLCLLTVNIFAIVWNRVLFDTTPHLWFLVTLFLIVCGMVLFNSTDILQVWWLHRLDRPWKHE